MRAQNEDVFVTERPPWWTVILHDIQFWVPLIVLMIGLLLLRIAR